MLQPDNLKFTCEQYREQVGQCHYKFQVSEEASGLDMLLTKELDILEFSRYKVQLND